MRSRRKYSITWSRDPDRSFGGIYKLIGPPYSLKAFHHSQPNGRQRLVRDAKRLLRAGFSAGYDLEIIPDLVEDEHMGCVDFVFTKC